MLSKSMGNRSWHTGAKASHCPKQSPPFTQVQQSEALQDTLISYIRTHVHSFDHMLARINILMSGLYVEVSLARVGRLGRMCACGARISRGARNFAWTLA